MIEYWTENRFAILVIDNINNSKLYYKDYELRSMLSGYSDIRHNPFWLDLYTKNLEFETEEEYRLLGLPFPVEEWNVYYHL